MWKRGSRSSALDRAQALLSAKRSSRGDAESVLGSADKIRGVVVGSVKSRSSPPNAHTLLADLSDLSSSSSAPEHGAAANTRGWEGDPTQDLRAQSPVGGRGSRFLKKAPPSATHSNQPPVSKSHVQQVPGPRNISTSMQSSQTAALSRLTQIESLISQHARRGPKPAENLTSDLGTSPPRAAQSLGTSVQLSAQSSSDHSLRGKRFLKNNAAVTVTNNNAAATAPQDPRGDVRSRSRAAHAVQVSGVNLESDEEDMRKLLGDSLDSSDNSLSTRGRPFSTRTADKNKSSQKVHSTCHPAAAPPSSFSNTGLPRSPASPSHRRSPFRFTGQAQTRFSPSVLSPCPSPPHTSRSLLGRVVSPRRAGSPQYSLSSMSGRSEVLSLEELFPVVPGSEDPPSEMSVVSSEDFKINVMTLDDLGFTEETARKEKETPSRRPQLRLEERREEQQEQEEEEDDNNNMLDYHSDFESKSRTEGDYSASLVSEHLHGHADEEEASEVREETQDSDVSCGSPDDDYSNTFSEASRSYTSRASDHSQTLSRSSHSRSSRSSRLSVSHGSHTFSSLSRNHASIRKVLKEAAVQTQPGALNYTWPTGMAILGPAGRMTFKDPTPVAAHPLSAEMVEALSNFDPAALALNALLKQQLAMTLQFIESSRRLHSSLVRSLEPPNYRYTTLEDIKDYIRKHRPPKLTMEEALEEALQEMRDV